MVCTYMLPQSPKYSLRVVFFTYIQTYSIAWIVVSLVSSLMFPPRFCRPAYQRRSKELPLPVAKHGRSQNAERVDQKKDEAIRAHQPPTTHFGNT